MDKFKFLQVKQTLSDIIGSKKRLRTLDLIHSLLFERELYKYEIALQNNRNIQLLNQFFEFAEEFNSIYPDNDVEDFTEYLSFASNFEIEEKNLEEQAITISTVHGVKGMQYPVVIIPDVIEHRLPTKFQKDKFSIPQDLLKLYVYGYLNQIRSSRKLEIECHRNVEVMWLMKKLAPDHKTIADFRKDNVDSIKPVFKEFVYLCRNLDLYGTQLVAIDGPKFKAVNSRSNNLSEKTVTLRLKQTEEKIAEYLKEMDKNDTVDEDERIKVDGLNEKIGKLEEERQRYERVQNQMNATGQNEVSLVDPDSRLMRVDSQRLEVCYNIQASVDAKRHLFVDYDVINNSTDHHQLARDAEAAKQILCVDRLDVVSDKGFYVEKDVFDCENSGVTVFMPMPAALNPHKSVGVPEPEFYSDRFVYDAARDIYVCPAGNDMPFWKRGSRAKGFEGRLYRSACCICCSLRSNCTRNKCGRYMFRGEYDGAVDRLRLRLGSFAGKEKVCLRRMLVEHPFGTMKRAFNQGYLLLKGLRKVKGEVGFTMLAYNMRRVINILGVGMLIAFLRA